MNIIEAIKKHPNIIARKPVAISDLVKVVNYELGREESIAAVSNVFKHKYYGINYKAIYRGVYVPEEKTLLELVESFLDKQNSIAIYWGTTLARVNNVSTQVMNKQEILIVGNYFEEINLYFDHKDSPIKLMFLGKGTTLTHNYSKEEFVLAKLLEYARVTTTIEKMKVAIELRKKVLNPEISQLNNSVLDALIDEDPLFYPNINSIFSSAEIFKNNEMYYENLERCIENAK